MRACLLATVLLVTGCDRDAEAPENPASSPPARAHAAPTPDTLSATAQQDQPRGVPLELRPTPEAPLPEVPPALLDDEAEPPPPVTVRGDAGSCDVRPTEPVCMAFTGRGWTTAAAQAECAEAPGGVFLSAACPAEDRIGECVYRPSGDATREIVSTFYAPMDPLIAEAVCRGTFRAR